jgi:SAM-dependent methyltransferase
MTPGRIDTTKPHPARMYDYYLGGKDHYEVDAQAAQQVLNHNPYAAHGARALRLFMQRSTRYLAAEAGIRQFLDIGTGIPTEPNLHQIAQGAQPDARIVYADNDPIVLTHARALLRSSPEGRTAYLDADVREPGKILDAAELHDTIDLSQPVALSLNALLHFVPDEFHAYDLVQAYADALAPGSYLVISHVTGDFDPVTLAKIIEIYRAGGIPAQTRTESEVARFFDGLELVEPGVVPVHRWRPTAGDPSSDYTNAQAASWAGVARKR